MFSSNSRGSFGVGSAATLIIVVTVLLSAGCTTSAPVRRPPVSAVEASGSEIGRERSRLGELARQRVEEQQERVERVGQRLIDHTPGNPSIKFSVATGNPQINAGATFGQVIVTSGILDFLENDDELAAVLGHEIAHISEGHVTKGLVGNVALTALAILVETQAPGMGQTAGGVGQLFLNRYTQEQERDADRVGLELAYRSGFDPSVAATVQERLAIAVPQTMDAGYFDTHPSSIERMVQLRAQAAMLLTQGPPPGREDAVPYSRGDREDVRDGDVAIPSRGARSGALDDVTLDCRRAKNYVRQAKATRDPVERERFYRRALRYCPALTAAQEGLERLKAE